ncbi:hypothetical protein QC761_610410 [Podospora bellae-mahoneyi]|uniref:Uncharacterized protein n=1 Tax=Podospora bellae-mahoneyi TaxID=2093777 RepID=A0ABR0FDQ2_9PEZI|nr:hypothetical protein QC761_610410 [Podospora bellae-mahoneyi]
MSTTSPSPSPSPSLSPSPSPLPSPLGPYVRLPSLETQLLTSAIQYLDEDRWKDAFKTICVAGHAMHSPPAKLHNLHLLPHINQLFEAIMLHHAYGVDHHVDHTINHILHLAVRTCQDAREDQHDTYSDECIRWMTPIEVEIRQYLQFYRMFCRYLENHSMSIESDRILDDVRNLIQKMCPTVNNLCGWVPRTPPRDIRQDMQGAAADNTPRRRSQRLRSHHSTPEPAASNPRQQRRSQRPRRRRVSPPPQLPTPPTQSGDLTCSSTYKTEDYIPSLLTPITQFSAPRSSQVPKVNEPEEEPTQLVGSRVLQFIKPPIPRTRLVEGGILPADFTSLRPVHIHVASQRCCSGL